MKCIDKKTKWLTVLSLSLMLVNAVILVLAHNWTALVWLIFGAGCFVTIMMLNQSNRTLHSLIVEQEDYIKEADEYIHYLTQFDLLKELRRANTAERVMAANCNRYLQGLVRLKKENDQLKILNKNLLHNQGKGVKNYAKDIIGRRNPR